MFRALACDVGRFRFYQSESMDMLSSDDRSVSSLLLEYAAQLD